MWWEGGESVNRVKLFSKGYVMARTHFLSKRMVPVLLGSFVGLATIVIGQTTGNGIGGGKPGCIYVLDIPPRSQSNVESGCTSWTECQESWQCPNVTPGVYNNCGTLTAFTRYCRDCTGGYWDINLHKCVVGNSGQCSDDYQNGTRTIWLDPILCEKK